MKFFEEFDPGEETDLGAHTFDAEEIVAFASRWDPQAFHIDDEAARRGPFGALSASGWHTACIWMRLYVTHLLSSRREREAAGEAVPRFGPSPGFRDLEWRRPVLAGDTIRYSSRVVETRPLNSHPEWGLVVSRNEGVNQTGELVFAFTGQVFAERRR